MEIRKNGAMAKHSKNYSNKHKMGWFKTFSEQQSGLLYNEPFVSPPAVIMDVKGETKDGCWMMKCNSEILPKLRTSFLFEAMHFPHLLE